MRADYVGAARQADPRLGLTLEQLTRSYSDLVLGQKSFERIELRFVRLAVEIHTSEAATTDLAVDGVPAFRSGPGPERVGLTEGFDGHTWQEMARQRGDAGRPLLLLFGCCPNEDNVDTATSRPPRVHRTRT